MSVEVSTAPLRILTWRSFLQTNKNQRTAELVGMVRSPKADCLDGKALCLAFSFSKCAFDFTVPQVDDSHAAHKKAQMGIGKLTARF